MGRLKGILGQPGVSERFELVKCEICFVRNPDREYLEHTEDMYQTPVLKAPDRNSNSAFSPEPEIPNP